ncbi:WD repeat domain 54-like [Amphiura filiformis]|uniref:WD repeat domain 54-like n=1 Tax=Amphiura filiformis TaxID=82378 RepID=UPI003B21395F
MYQKAKPLHIKGSASLLYNNLSVLAMPEKNMASYGVVHKSTVCLANCSNDTMNVNHKQVACKEPSAALSQLTMILQAKFCSLPSRSLLVMCYQRASRYIFESDGSALVFWHALSNADPAAGFLFARGIAVVGDAYIAVGTSQGSILVFSIPARGTNIMLSETLTGHNYAISDMAGQGTKMASGDDSGCITIWEGGEKFKQITRINGSGTSCSSVCLYDDLVIAGYGTGHVRLFDSDKGHMMVEICAHAKWIHAIDVAPSTGLLLTSGEDTCVRVWSIQKAENGAKVSLEYSDSVTDVQLTGAKFMDSDGKAFGVTGYDLNEIVVFKQKV